MIKNLFGILVIVSVNVIKPVILVNIYIMKVVSAEKRLVDKLVDECTETVEKAKLAKRILTENENSYKCTSCTVYTALFWIFFTINVGGIGTYFTYFYGHLKKMFTRETTA